MDGQAEASEGGRECGSKDVMDEQKDSQIKGGRVVIVIVLNSQLKN